MRSAGVALAALAAAGAVAVEPAAAAPAAPLGSAPAATLEPAPAATLEPAPGAAPAAVAAAAAARQQRFLALLRTYPERSPEESLALVAALVDEGPFEEHDRAESWIGSARLSVGDRAGARAWLARVGRDHPGSPWAERALLGLAEAAMQEHGYGDALSLYGRAEQARDPGVRELAGLARRQVLVLRSRQLWARGALAFACAVGLGLSVSIARLRAPLRPLPAELRVAGPALAALALLSLRQDPAPRAAVLEIAAAGAVFAALSGLRLRALASAPGMFRRGLHLFAVLGAIGACCYAAVHQNDLWGMVLETVRAGPG